jgi:DNA-binding IclR family transcriptional regulator
MSLAERMVLFAIGDSGSPSFSDLSVRLRMHTPALHRTLHDLARRNFITEDGGRYRLQPGVMSALSEL